MRFTNPKLGGSILVVSVALLAAGSFCPYSVGLCVEEEFSIPESSALLVDSGQVGGEPFRPNILLILIDDIGTDQLEIYDVANGGLHNFEVNGTPNLAHTYAETPNINALAASGVRFNWAFTSPTCSPTRAQLWTGRYPFRTGIGGIVRPNGNNDDFMPEIQEQLDLPLDEQTLPELLAEVGYSTALIGKWHLAREESNEFGVPSAFNIAMGTTYFPAGPPNVPGRAHPALSGWSYFAGLMQNPQNSPGPNNSLLPISICPSNPILPAPDCPLRDHYSWLRVESIPSPLPTRDDAVWTAETVSVLGSPIDANARAAAFITTVQRQDLVDWISTGQRPFFAVWSTSAPHGPFQPSPSALLPDPILCPLNNPTTPTPANNIWDNYQDLIQSLDTELGLLLADLAPLPGRNGPSLLEETTIILMGDNGTPIGAARTAEFFASQCSGLTENRVAPQETHSFDQDVTQMRFKGSPYLTGTSIPLIYSGFGVSSAQGCGVFDQPTGRVVEQAIVETVDVFRTILDLAGAVPPAGVTLDGASMAPFLGCGSASDFSSACSLTYSPNGCFGCARMIDVGFTARVSVSNPAAPTISPAGQEVFRLVRRSDLNPATMTMPCPDFVERFYRVFPDPAGAPVGRGVLEEDDLLPMTTSQPMSLENLVLIEMRAAMDAILDQGLTSPLCPSCFDACDSPTSPCNATCPSHDQL